MKKFSIALLYPGRITVKPRLRTRRARQRRPAVTVRDEDLEKDYCTTWSRAAILQLKKAYVRHQALRRNRRRNPISRSG